MDGFLEAISNFHGASLRAFEGLLGCFFLQQHTNDTPFLQKLHELFLKTLKKVFTFNFCCDSINRFSLWVDFFLTGEYRNEKWNFESFAAN